MSEHEDGSAGPWTRGPPIWRSLVDGDLAFFPTQRPAGAPVDTPLSVAGRSRTASRPPRTSSGSTTKRRAPGTAGTAMPAAVLRRARGAAPEDPGPPTSSLDGTGDARTEPPRDAHAWREKCDCNVRACPRTSQTTAAVRWMAPRKWLARLSWSVAIAGCCFSLAAKLSIV